MGYQARLDLTHANGVRWRGAHRPDFVDLRDILSRMAAVEPDAEQAEDPLDVWVDALPSGVHAMEILSPSALRLRVDDAPLAKDLVLKRVGPRPPVGVGRLTARWQPSRAARAYAWAHRLTAHGILTPRPLGYLEAASAPRRFASAVVTEFVAAPTLIDLRNRRRLGDKRRLIARLADLLARLHAHRLFHADLHADNLLVSDEGLWLLDLESMRPLGRRRRIAHRNLVRLNRDFLDLELVSRADRLRLLDRYLRHEAGRAARRRVLYREVEAATVQKLAERQERFRGGSAGRVPL